MQTHRPQKYLLRITIESENKSIQNHHLDILCLEKVLRKSIGGLPKGDLKEICKIENIFILMWDFEKFTPCHLASYTSFGGIIPLERHFTIENASSLRGKGDITLPFFTLVTNKKTGDLYKDLFYTFPECSESDRVDALRNSLQANGYIVRKCDSSRNTEHYCEFSGDGDIYIYKDNIPEVNIPVMVFTVPEDSSPDEDPPATESPPILGDTKLISLTIEAKKDTCEYEALKFQLWANMFAIITSKFRESLRHFKRKELLELKRLTGYGLACSGDGITGAYKIEMDLIDGETAIIEKLPIGRRDILRAAALMDHALDYYKQIS